MRGYSDEKYSDNCRTCLCYNMKKRMRIENVSDKQMAAAVGHTLSSFQKKMKPESCVFTTEQLYVIFRKLKFKDYEILESMSEVMK